MNANIFPKKERLGLVYGRYMDDFYIISSDKLLLRRILKEIEEYIKPLGLRLNKKTQISPLKNGIDFLGFHTYLTSTGKVVRKVRAGAATYHTATPTTCGRTWTPTSSAISRS